eukprot:Opistho-1_new@95806
MLGRHVFCHALVDQRLDIADQQLVDHALRIGLVDVVPRVLAFLDLQRVCGQRQQLLDERLLLDRVDELRVAQVHGRELAFRVSVEQRLDRADELVQMRRVTQMGDVRHHAGTDAVQEAQALAADGDRLDRHAGRLRFAQLGRHGAQQVGVQATAQALVARHDDEADRLGVVLLHEGVRILGIRLAKVRRDVADLLAVGACGTHALLRLAHLGNRDHFHGLGDLLGVLHRFDLAADFLTSCHMSSFLRRSKGRSGERLLERGGCCQQFGFGVLAHLLEGLLFRAVVRLGRLDVPLGTMLFHGFEQGGVARLQQLVEAVFEREHLLDVDVVHEAHVLCVD